MNESARVGNKNISNKVALIAALLILLAAAVYVMFTMPSSKSNQGNAALLQNEGVFSSNFEAFAKEYESKTDIQQNEYFKELKYKKVQWSGQVYNVFEDRLEKKYHVMLWAGGTRFINNILSDSEQVNLASLNKGDLITIRGYITGQGGGTEPWVITDTKIIK